jgi:hypothetical protein
MGDKRTRGIIFVLLTLGGRWLQRRYGFASEPASGPSRYVDRWLCCSFDLQVDHSVDDLIGLLNRATRSGYTGILLSDYKFQVLYRVPDFYFRNVEKVKTVAARLGLELGPAVFAIGHSNGRLAQDRNLAEGLPVVDQPYVVNDRANREVPTRISADGESNSTEARRLVAELASSPETRLHNGGLEETREADQFAGFFFQDDPGPGSFADRSVSHSGSVSCRLEPGSAAKEHTAINLRLIQSVSIRPHAAYRFSCWVKTRDLFSTGSFHLLALGTAHGGRPLTFHERGVDPTQDWKRVEVDSNSLNEHQVNLYAGIRRRGRGTMWIDDLSLDEIALVNVLRRDGCQFSVKSPDGKTTYIEGRDYDPVLDPKLGQTPWNGEFESNHSGPSIQITPHARIKSGHQLRVSWYHPVVTHGSQAMCCLSEPKLEKLLCDQAERINRIFKPRTFFMSHDEIRVVNWCRACQDRKQTPGQLLADNVRRSTAILKSVNPTGAGCRLVGHVRPLSQRGRRVLPCKRLTQEFLGGPPEQVIVANWNSGKATDSLSFFAKRGHPQITAGFFDDDDLMIFRDWDTVARGRRGII